MEPASKCSVDFKGSCAEDSGHFVYTMKHTAGGVV